MTRDPIQEQKEAREGGSKRRILNARWIVTGEIVTTSASLFGQNEGDTADATFERTEDGKPVLRGASLAGALRSHLCDVLAGYRSAEPAAVKILFGDQKDYAHESRLLFYDAVAREKAGEQVRDGVRIDAATRLAKDGFKYDAELMNAGVVFPFRIELIVKKTEDKDATQISDVECKLVTHLGILLDALANGDIAFGVRKTRGRGQTKAQNIRALRLDLTGKTDWEKYAELGYGADALTNHPDAADCAGDYPSDSLIAICPTGLENVLDNRRSLCLAFHLEIPHTLLIRSPSDTATGADVVHLRETRPGKKEPQMILSGTSLAGALRAQAGRILRTIGKTEEDTNTLLNSLFGNTDTKNTAASRFRVEDAVIEGAGTHRQSRVKIDRFTGGAYDTALFDEEPSIGGKAVFTAHVRQTQADDPMENCDLPLLLLVCRDLLDGLVTLGGGAAIGRGRVHGKITIHEGAKQFVVHSDGKKTATVTPAEDTILKPLIEYKGNS